MSFGRPSGSVSLPTRPVAAHATAIDCGDIFRKTLKYSVMLLALVVVVVLLSAYVVPWVVPTDIVAAV